MRIATSLFPWPQDSSIAMARTSRLEGRLLAILDRRRNRRSLTRLGLLLAAILVSGLVVPISILRATAGGEAAGNDPNGAATQPTVPEGSLPTRPASAPGVGPAATRPAAAPGGASPRTQPGGEWGLAEGGIQVRLRAGGQTSGVIWSSKGPAAAKKPQILMDVRNRAVDVLSIAGRQFLEIELDGRWYSHEPAGSLIVGPFDKLAPEDEPQGYELPLWLPWLSKDKPNQGLDLGEGRHTLRVALIGKAGTHAIRAVSNLLEVEVLGESATGSAAGRAASPRGSSAGSQSAPARSSAASDVRRLEEELRGLERQVDTETRLRGRGETHPTVVALRKRIALANEWLAWAKTKAATQSSDSSSEVARLEEELRRLERQLDVQTRLNQMTETHPAVVALRKRIALVKEWLNEAYVRSATGPASRPASRPWPQSLPTSLRFPGGEDRLPAEMFLERYKHPGPIGPYESVPAATTASRPSP